MEIVKSVGNYILPQPDLFVDWVSTFPCLACVAPLTWANPGFPYD